MPVPTDIATEPTVAGAAAAALSNGNPGAVPAGTGSQSRLTTNFGVPVSTTEDQLTAGDRGPTLLEDFHFLEKLQSFDRERIPERVVHARGTGAFGYFEPYGPTDGFDITKICKAAVFKPGTRTPLFLRLSTVQGSRGSADNVRDVRGFAVKFYTAEGNWDLVGNNIPVFFIQNGISFPDLVHALKPEPKMEMPQAATAHDSFWDFISQKPESTHMVMWILSDRTVPRTLRNIQGFGVHTFVLQNEQGDETFVKFHWIPEQGLESNLWDEQQKTAGKDPDFQRRDFYDNINRGVFPAWEFGVQVVKPEDAEKFDFDLLDPTKIIPESLVTVHKIGRMVIDKAPDEFFTQVEQSGFAPSRVPPGITFSNDPMLQSRIFSYHDTQLHRMGPNFHLLPTNAPRCPFDNNQRDGFMAFKVNSSNVNYFPHGIDQGKGPKPVAEGAHQHSQLSTGLSSAVAGSQEDRMTTKVAARPTAKFSDHFSQATLFWNSLSEPEKNHLVAAAWFELGKCERMATRELMVGRFNHVDHELAKRVASGLGVAPPKQAAVKNHGQTTKGLSILEFRPKNVAGKKIAILVAEGVSGRQIAAFKAEVEKNGAVCEVISATFGPIKTVDGQKELVPDKMLIHVSSTFYDAVWVPGGTEMHIDALKRDGLAVHFINEQFKHCKPIAASGNGIDLLAASALPTIGLANSTSSTSPDEGVTSKIGASVSKVAQKAMWAMTAAVPESMEAEMGVLTSRSDDDASVRSIWGMLKDALIKGRTFQRENDPRVPA
ncbi:catalase [Hyaloraphidium curvatum]|nr:catalase [Hyaloraphidium curvatum]